jgi:hypothetical protein
MEDLAIFSILIKTLSAYFPFSTDFSLTRLFHLVKSRSRCTNKLRSKRRKAESQWAAVRPWHFNKAKTEMIYTLLGNFF